MIDDTSLLKRSGWTLECLSPLEIRHLETGSFASKLAAECVLAQLRKDFEAEDVVPSSIQELRQLFREVKSLTNRACEAKKVETWKHVYSLIFSKTLSQRIGILLEKEGSPLSYYDPDEDYEDDVMAYANAISEKAAVLGNTYPGFGILS